MILTVDKPTTPPKSVKERFRIPLVNSKGKLQYYYYTVYDDMSATLKPCKIQGRFQKIIYLLRTMELA